MVLHIRFEVRSLFLGCFTLEGENIVGFHRIVWRGLFIKCKGLSKDRVVHNGSSWANSGRFQRKFQTTFLK